MLLTNKQKREYIKTDGMLCPVCDDSENNIIPCFHCGNDTCFENDGSNPKIREGESCSECGDWVCVDCVNWSKSGDNGVVCKNCSH